jgi:hypothetical protein
LECEKYSEPMWNVFEQVINNAIQLDTGEINVRHIRVHAFMILYNVDTNVPSKYKKFIMEIIQEIKRNMIFRRYKRETGNGANIEYRRERLIAHLMLTTQKLASLRQYQGRNTMFFEQMQNAMRAMIS